MPFTHKGRVVDRDPETYGFNSPNGLIRVPIKTLLVSRNWSRTGKRKWLEAEVGSCGLFTGAKLFLFQEGPKTSTAFEISVNMLVKKLQACISHEASITPFEG